MSYIVFARDHGYINLDEEFRAPLVSQFPVSLSSEICKIC